MMMSQLYKMTRYVLVGAFVFLLQFFTLAIFVEARILEPLVASVVAFVVALVSSFFLQRRVTFQKFGSDRIGREFLLTATLSLFNLGFNTAVMYLLLDKGTHYMVAQAIATTVIVSYTYVAYHLIFRV